jgi:hypothetical protein
MTTKERVDTFTIEERLVIFKMTNNYQFLTSGYEFELKLLDALMFAPREAQIPFEQGTLRPIWMALKAWRDGNLSTRYREIMEAE